MLNNNRSGIDSEFPARSLKLKFTLLSLVIVIRVPIYLTLTCAVEDNFYTSQGFSIPPYHFSCGPFSTTTYWVFLQAKSKNMICGWSIFPVTTSLFPNYFIHIEDIPASHYIWQNLDPVGSNGISPQLLHFNFIQLPIKKYYFKLVPFVWDLFRAQKLELVNAITSLKFHYYSLCTLPNQLTNAFKTPKPKLRGGGERAINRLQQR